MAADAFNVYRPSRSTGKPVLIDTVFAQGYDVEEMTRSLINHDGYPTDIVVKKVSKRK